MRQYFCALFFLVPLLFAVEKAAAQGPLACGNRSAIVEKLGDTYSETPIAMGLSADGAMVEVFASAEGTFTIIATQPSGTSCVLMTGESWEGVPAMAAGLPI